jgi:ABC-type proline/glycine betaine transport system ATPase subunit
MNGRVVQTGTPREVFRTPADGDVERLVRAAIDLTRTLDGE